MRTEADTYTPDLFTGATYSAHDASTLTAMREKWHQTIADDGGCCPVCGRWGKVYRYRLTQSLAAALRWIADHGNAEGWADVQKGGPRWMLRSKTYPLLAHWGLVESREFGSGIWRVTASGARFLAGTETAPRAVFVYDNRIMDVEDERVTFRGCFGVKFDFDALMGGAVDWAAVAAAMTTPATKRQSTTTEARRWNS